MEIRRYVVPVGQSLMAAVGCGERANPVGPSLSAETSKSRLAVQPNSETVPHTIDQRRPR